MPKATVLQLAGQKTPSALQVQGWVYKVLARDHPSIHDAEGPKPFSVAVGTNGDKTSWVRVAFLDDGLARTFSEHVWELNPPVIPLGNGPARIAAILELSHPLAGENSWSELLSTTPAADLPLEFLRPTFFRRRGFNYPLPEPGLVLSSLAQKWSAYAPEPIGQADLTELINKTTVRFMNGQTVSARAHERTVGFVGRVTYHIPRASTKEALWLARLGKLAFFSGVGAKTTLGFGLVRMYSLAKSGDENKAQTRPRSGSAS